MKTRLIYWWDTLRTSFWFVPSLFAVGAVVMALVMPLVDEALGTRGWDPPEWVRTTTDASRATLSAVAGAMVAVTGTVFSITIVTLSLTSQQFGPRLLRRFMYDLPTQITLGVFLSTGFYCLLVIRIIEQRDDGLAAPHLTVLLAVLLAVLSMAMLIVFIHHVAILIQAPQVVAAVAHDLDAAINRIFPEQIGQPATEDEKCDTAAQREESGLEEEGRWIAATKEGYIEALDGEGLLELACQANIILRFAVRPGSFIGEGSLLAEVFPSSRERTDDEQPSDHDPPDDEEIDRRLNEAVITGIRRTPRQDFECAIDELVEVAVRALSPGINDPFTAITCIDRLGSSLGRLARRKLPPTHRCDSDHRLRLITRRVTFAGALEAAFNQIRQYGSSSVAVASRLLEALEHIGRFTSRKQDCEAVRLHADMVSRLAENFAEEHDKESIRERYERVLAVLSEK